MKMQNILILCTGNSCRSQMTEGYLKHFAKGRANIFSTGIEAHGVNPKAIQVMQEDGIDISNHTSKTIDELLNSPPIREKEFDFIITVCDHAKENCPYFPSSAKKVHHNFPNPAKARGNDEEILQEFRKVRDMIKIYSQNFIEQNLFEGENK